MYTPQNPISGLLRLCIGRPITFIFLFVPVIVGLLLSRNFDSGTVATIQHTANVYQQEICGAIPISYAFDDGYESVYDKAFPILQKLNKEHDLNITATSYVITGKVGTEGHMTLIQLIELYNNGWEIGSHTVTHPELVDIDDKQLQKEIADSKKWLEVEGFEVFTIASPYGLYDERVVDVMKQHYYGNRTTELGLNDIPLKNPTEDLYRLKTVFFEGDMTLEEIKAWVDKAFAEGKFLIISFHRVDDIHKVEGEAKLYTTDIEEFEELTRYVLSKAQNYNIGCTDSMPTDLPPLPLK